MLLHILNQPIPQTPQRKTKWYTNNGGVHLEPTILEDIQFLIINQQSVKVNNARQQSFNLERASSKEDWWTKAVQIYIMNIKHIKQRKDLTARPEIHTGQFQS